MGSWQSSVWAACHLVFDLFYFVCGWFNDCQLWKILANHTYKLVQPWAVLLSTLFLRASREILELFVHYVYFALGFPHGYQTISEFLRQKYQRQMRWTFSRQPQHFSVWLYRPLQWDQIHNRGALFQVPGCRFCGCVTSWRYHSSTFRTTEVIAALHR